MPDQNELNTGVFSSATSKPRVADVPQFSTAEYAHIPGTERCRICNTLISGEYYRVNGQMACTVCARQASEGQPTDSHAAFLRGIALGIGAAIVAMAAYATFTIVTHIYLGYLALGVGWFVAKAIAKGSNGLGGRRYQITAVLLTYVAISLAEIPIALAQLGANPKFHGSMALIVLRLWPRLLWVGIASPFLQLRNPISGALGVFILFIGLRIAWQFTAARPLAVDGPYPVGG